MSSSYILLTLTLLLTLQMVSTLPTTSGVHLNQPSLKSTEYSDEKAEDYSLPYSKEEIRELAEFIREYSRISKGDSRRPPLMSFNSFIKAMSPRKRMFGDDSFHGVGK